MSLPICDICAKTKVLCNACIAKLEKGEISELDVKLSEYVYEVGKGSFGFEKAIDTENFIVLLVERSDIGKILGEGGENLAKLEEKVGKEIKPMPAGNYMEIIYNLIRPATIVGVSKVYKTDGTTTKKIIISKKDGKNIRMDISTIKEIVSKLTNENIEILFGDKFY
ncbi:MAG: hypothetical protein ACK4YO_01720 [Candidatus Altarchaeaceae archaeon]